MPKALSLSSMWCRFTIKTDRGVTDIERQAVELFGTQVSDRYIFIPPEKINDATYITNVIDYLENIPEVKGFCGWNELDFAPEKSDPRILDIGFTYKNLF